MPSESPTGREPLRRKPKKLTDAPLVFQRGTSPMALATADDDEQEAGAPPRTATSLTATGDDSAMRTLADLLTEEPDPAIHQAARDLATRLWLRPRSPDLSRQRGTKTMARRYRDDADDIDVERTIGVLVDLQRNLSTLRDVEEDDIVVQARRSPRRAVALVVDVSGSMTGEKANIVGAVVGALVAQLRGDELSVIAFWKDCALLTQPNQPVDPRAVLDDVLRLPRKGLTNVHAGLAAAALQLARTSARDRLAVLLSDCVHNAGPDPRLAAAALPRLHVLLETDGEHDAWLARQLATAGRGRLATARTCRDAGPAINTLFSVG